MASLKKGNSRGAFRVGDWVVEPLSGEVHAVGSARDAGQRRVLEPRVVRLLGYLARNPGRIVSKEELIDSVWDGAFVTDHALWRAVSRLRDLLDDDPKTPRILETLPRRGYRMIAPVSFAAGRLAAPGATQWGRLRSPLAAAAGTLAGLVVGGVIALGLGQGRVQRAPEASRVGWAENAAAIEELEGRLREGSEEPELLAALADAYATRWFRYSASTSDWRWASAALTTSARALSLAPESPVVLEAHGQTLHAVGRERDAIAAYRRALALRPEALSTATGLAHALRDAGVLGESELLHRRVLDRDATFAESRIGLARTLLLEGEYSEADRQLSRVLLESRSASGLEANAAALRVRAALLRNRRGEARALAARFVAEYGDHPAVLEAAACVAQLDGRLDDARRLLLRATSDEHKGGNGAAFLRLASVLAAQGDVETTAGILDVFSAWAATVDSGGSDHWRGAYWRAASASIRGDGEAAARKLAVAVERGYLDHAWVAIDPIWSGLRAYAGAEGLLARMRQAVENASSGAAGAGSGGPADEAAGTLAAAVAAGA